MAGGRDRADGGRARAGRVRPVCTDRVDHRGAGSECPERPGRQLRSMGRWRAESPPSAARCAPSSSGRGRPTHAGGPPGPITRRPCGASLRPSAGTSAAGWSSRRSAITPPRNGWAQRGGDQAGAAARLGTQRGPRRTVALRRRPRGQGPLPHARRRAHRGRRWAASILRGVLSVPCRTRRVSPRPHTMETSPSPCASTRRRVRLRRGAAGGIVVRSEAGTVKPVRERVLSAHRVAITLGAPVEGALTVSLGDGRTSAGARVPADTSPWHLPALMFIDRPVTLVTP